MSRLKFNLLLLILFFIFTQGMWERILVIGSLIAQLFLELVIITFIIYQFKIPKSIPGKHLLIVLILSGIFSGLYNGNGIFETFMFLRYFIYGILIYYQLYYYHLGTERWIKLFKFLFFLITLQGIGAFYNIFILGERVEGYVGLMSSLGGTTATSFPLLVSSIVLLVFLFSKKTTKLSISITLILFMSVFLVGFSSGKRAIYFVIPLFFVFIFFLSFLKIGSKSFFKKNFFMFTIMFVLFIPLILFGVNESRGLNYGLSGNENSVQIIKNAFSYAEEYESKTADGVTIGRSNTTEKIITKIEEDTDFLLFGNGYNTINDEAELFRLGVGYGIVGLTRDIVSAGVIFAILVVFLILILIYGNKYKIRDNFSSSLRIILIFVFFFVHFSYSSDFTSHLKLTSIIFILMSLINSPVHQESYKEISKKMEITN